MPYQLKSFAVSAAILAIASTAMAQQPSPNVPQPGIKTDEPFPAPTGHRQPTLRDLPPGLAHEEQTGEQSNSAESTGPGASGGPQRPSRTKSRSSSSVPKLDAGTSCKAAAAASVVAGRDVQACLGDENQAKEQMTKNWSQYRDADKQQCIELVGKGGPSSYVELLTCLEVLKDARAISSADLGGPLFKNGSVDVRAMDASVLNEFGQNMGDGQVKGQNPKAKKRRDQRP